MLTDKHQVKAAKETLLDDPDLADLLAENKVAEGRPINDLEKLVDPGDQVKHPYYLQPWFRISAVAIPLLIIGIFSYKVWGPKAEPVLALGDKDRQINELTTQLQQSDSKKAELEQKNLELTQGEEIEQMQSPPPPPSASKSNPKSQSAPPPPAAVQPQNVIKVPPTPKVSKANRFRAQPQAKTPSVRECVEYIKGNIKVPGCERHRITQIPKPTSSTLSKGAAPTVKPPQPSPKPIPLAVAKPDKAKPRLKKQTDYQVNYLAGEIQTMDQFDAEFYGKGQPGSAATLTRMQAKVIDQVEWLSPEDAQQLVIPLQITSGPHKGQTAEAKIQQMNGVQFMAEVIRINDQEVEPGTLELRRNNTKYLRAKVKRQGGESMGDKLLGTVTAIGGEIATDRLADVRGGSHLSRLIPNSQGQSRQITQSWRFEGEVELVPVS